MMNNTIVIREALKKLKIPYNKNIWNFRFEHFENLQEEIGYSKINRQLREILIYYKNEEVFAEKIRILIRHLDKKFLVESAKEYPVCECGYVIMQEDEFCPVCNKKMYKGKECYYKDEDFCTQTGKKCVWSTYHECGKMKR